MATEFSDLTDEQWFDKISGRTGEKLFELPDEKIQTGTVGRSGEPILRDAFMFYQFTREMLNTHGSGLTDTTKVLDFGCAWGRIIRFWLQHVSPNNLHGFEVQENLLEYARQHVPGPNYTVSNTRPPLPNGGQKFDLIYAFSVFSHLPEALTNEWIEEFSKILNTGGIACLTTRPRAHISVAGTKESNTAHSSLYAKLFQNKDDALSRYDKGQFVFYPAHGGGTLNEENYGEAIIPPAYAKTRWSKNLEVIGYFEKYSATYLQPCFVLRKK